MNEIHTAMQLLDSRQLRAFVTLAHTGSFTRTAQELNLTQSAVSHAIRNLESDIGCQLLYRSGRKVIVSPQGKRFLTHAESILQEMNQARAAVSSMELSERGQLRIGCSNAGAQFILPPVLREFKECFPKFDISIQPAETPGALELLQQNTVDLVITVKDKESDRYCCRELLTDELYLLVGPLHPWAATGKAPKAELRNQNYILYQRRTVTFGMVEEYFLRQGIRLRSLIEPGSVETMKELVKLGLGVGIAAPWVARKELSEGSLAAIPLRPKIQRTWVAMTLKNRTLNLAEETFLGLVKDVCDTFVDEGV